MRLTLLSLLLAVLPLSLFGQMTEYEVRNIVNDPQTSEQELVVMCSQMMQANYLFQAEIVVDKLLSLKPLSSNYNYRKGYIVLASRLDYTVAMRHLQLSIGNTNKNYDMFSAKEESAAVDAFYHLAKCYHLNEEIDKAREHYQLFINESAKGSEIVDDAELGLIQCDVAEYNIGHPKTAVVENIGNGVNTDAAEYSPVISLDGNSLYFTSRRAWADGSTDAFRDPQLNQYPEDIFVSYLDFDGEWTSPEKLAFCKDQYNEATIAVSADEKQIYVYEDATGGGDIYYSDFTNNVFTALNELDYTEVNTKFWETHCTMTPDGQTMYFVSDRPGGYGGRDIYRIVRLPSGEWSKATNMGPIINTPYDEDSPYIDINNKTLYFGSNGSKSMGGFDIFVSFKDEEGVWSDPVNMGTPVNSTGDDLFYTTTIDGLRGYLTSFRKGGYGEKDIYEIQNDYLGNYPFSTLKGSFISLHDQEVPEGFSVKLLCPTCEQEKNRNSDLRIKNNGYFSVLERCKDYTIEYYDGKGKLVNSETFTTACDSQNEELEKNHYIGDYVLDMAVLISDGQDLTPISGAKVEFFIPEGETLAKTYEMDENGRKVVDLIKDKQPGERVRYNVRVSKPGYITQTFVVDTLLGTQGTLKLEFLLQRSTVGIDIAKTFDLKPIYFDLDKSNIRPDAAIELDKIVKIMNENPELKIELGSHTDCRASKSYNMKLSDRRAVSSADYIKSRISNPSRIYGKGYGESKLLNGCECEGTVTSSCSDEEHQLNRRTEFRIVE